MAWYIFIDEVQHNSGPRIYNMTPSRELMAKQLAWRDYCALSKAFVNACSNAAIEEMGRIIKMHVCSNNHNSLLQSCATDINRFSWESIWEELEENTPKLVLLLSIICPKDSIILKSIVICMMLKQNNPKMSLLQRVTSVMMYGNAVHKSVCYNYWVIMLVYIHIHIHTYIYIYTHTHTHTHIHAYIHIID